MEASLINLANHNHDDVDVDNSAFGLPEFELDDSWSKDDDKLLENMLLEVPKNHPDRFELISICFPVKTAEQVVKRYNELVKDVEAIEAGAVPFPDYVDKLDWEVVVEKPEKKRRCPESRWSVAEHELFLKGLKELGNGDWKGIARKFLPTRTSSQVASHAQKYFKRQNDQNNRTTRKRYSIHDVKLKVQEKQQPAVPEECTPPTNQDMQQEQEQEPQ